MSKTTQAVRGISRWLARLGGLLILFCAFLVTLDVIFRNLLSLSIFESFELSTYGIALATSFGMAWALVTRAHIRIEVLYVALPSRGRAYLDLCALALLVVFIGMLVYYGGVVVWDSWTLGARSNTTLHVPMALPQGLWLMGLVWFGLCALILLVVAFAAVIRGHHENVQTLFGIASVSDEVEASMEGTDLAGKRDAESASSRMKMSSEGA